MEAEKEFLQEGIDLRFFLLRLFDSLWIVFVAALFGAAICAGGYSLYKAVNKEAKEFQAVTKYYIDFAEDSTGIGYGYYNDFTWNDLMKSDDVLQYTLSLLPETISQETVENAVVADIISDVRLLTITVTTSDREISDEIARATAKSLEHYPEELKEIDSIRVIREEKAKEIILGDLTKNWCFFGMITGILVSLFTRWMMYCMDASVYLPGEIEKRFGIPVLGIFYRKENSGVKEDRERVFGGKELEANMAYLLREKEKIAVISVIETKHTGEMFEKLKTAGSINRKELVYTGSYGNTDYESVRNADAVIICFSYGGKDGRLAERYVSDLKKQGCKAVYACLYDADEKMYRRYYWGRGKQALLVKSEKLEG